MFPASPTFCIAGKGSTLTFIVKDEEKRDGMEHRMQIACCRRPLAWVRDRYELNCVPPKDILKL